MQTVLVDPSGWTLHEFGEVVSNEEVLDYVQKVEGEVYSFEIEQDDKAIPPHTYIWRTYRLTGKRTLLGFIKQRE